MENENVVLCPVHKKILRLEIRKLEIVGKECDVVTGHCPICKKVYTGTLLKGCPKFVLNETLYCSLSDMDEFQNEERKDVLNFKIKLQNDKNEQEKDSEIRKDNPENQRKERKRQEAERKKREEERKKERKKTQEKQQEAELAKKEEKIIAMMPKTIYVVENPVTYSCPACKRKTSWIARSLALQRENGRLKNLTLFGLTCKYCQRVFVSEKVAGKDFLERYVERINFDYFHVPEEKTEDKQRQHKIMKKENDGSISDRTAECESQYPCLKNRQLKIQIIKNIQNVCPMDCSLVKRTTWDLSRAKGEPTTLLQGWYCTKCNVLYIASQDKKRLDHFDRQYGPKKIPYKALPTEFRSSKIKPAQVTSIELFKGKVNLEQLSTNWVRRTYNQEIIALSATVDGKEKIIRILTLVTGKEERECAPDELLVRESESTGRELLGRIAHNQLGVFTSKYGTIKIHNYKVWPGQEHHLDGFTRFCDPENIQNITIMSQNNISRDSDEYEMVTALVYCANREEPVYIDVYYSKRQNKYFINEESYRQYRLRYGLPYVHLVADEYDGDMDYGNLRKNSELNLYGYTVAKAAEMTTGERQRLLQQLMDNGLMSKHQIVNHLEWLIHRQSGRVKMEDACDCWREDLRFVNSYRLNAQRKIQGRFVYGKTVLR